MSKNVFYFIGFPPYYCTQKKEQNGIEFGDIIFVKNKLKSNKKFVISIYLANIMIYLLKI